MLKIDLHPVAYVKNERKDPLNDDYWGGIVSEIRLIDTIPADALKGLEKNSHVEIVFYMHKAKEFSLPDYVSRAKNNKNFPKTGVFAQRSISRPNYIATTIVKLLTIVDKCVYVQNLDAIDGTPVLDIKPVYKEYLPEDMVEHPDWITESMSNYWEESI